MTASIVEFASYFLTLYIEGMQLFEILITAANDHADWLKRLPLPQRIAVTLALVPFGIWVIYHKLVLIRDANTAGPMRHPADAAKPHSPEHSREKLP
jgi:hypothetical protein